MLDRTGKRSRWQQAKQSESSYNRRLQQVARQIDMLVKGFIPSSGAMKTAAMIRALQGYAELLLPWATSVAEYMVADVNRRNLKLWETNSQDIGKAIRTEIKYAPTGAVYQELMGQQVVLIQSLPLDAAERVHNLVDEGLTSGRRAEDIVAMIEASGSVSKSRATLIARTETSRAASNFTQARAMFAGSRGYIWRTSKDADVRETHQHMEGVYVPWEEPPKTDKNLAPYHAGCGPNCRCFPDPVLPDL